MPLRPVDAPALGRELVVPLQRRHVRIAIAAAVVALAGVGALVAGHAFATRSPDRLKGLVVELGGVMLLAVAAYAAYTAVRVRRHPALELRIGTREIRFPHHPLVLGRATTLPFGDIEKVATTAGWILLAARGAMHRVSLALVDPAWRAVDIAARVELRWKLARAGAGAAQVAGAEAMLLAERPGLGAVVSEASGAPVVLGVIDVADELAAVVATEPAARLVVPADVAPALPAAVADRVVALPAA